MASSPLKMTAKDRAYAFTKERVLDSTYAGGDLITEGEVADALGMSRTPVREAFLRLEGEGLLRLYPKRGALVVPVSVGEVEAVMETRMLVERFALDKVLADGPAEVLARAMGDRIAGAADRRRRRGRLRRRRP
jgi:DNA-binding GntR family transcriptional regulator